MQEPTPTHQPTERPRPLPLTVFPAILTWVHLSKTPSGAPLTNIFVGPPSEGVNMVDMDLRSRENSSVSSLIYWLFPTHWTSIYIYIGLCVWTILFSWTTESDVEEVVKRRLGLRGEKRSNREMWHERKYNIRSLNFIKYESCNRGWITIWSI